MECDAEFDHFDFVRVVKGLHCNKLAEYHGLDRDGVAFCVFLIVERKAISVPFGGLVRASAEDFSIEEATSIAREWMEKLGDPTFRFKDFSDDEIVEGEGGGGAIICAREELDGFRLEPIIVNLLAHHIEVPAVAALLGKMLAHNELLLIEEKRMEEAVELRYERAWGTKPVGHHRDPTEWLVDHGGLCP